MKIPKCKYCGQVGHYQYQCYKRILAERQNKPIQRVQNPKRHKLVARKTKPVKRAGNGRKQAIQRLDKLVSQYTRWSRMDRNGNVRCYTCGRAIPWQMIDCGHFRSRRYIQTRFDLDNVRPQCRQCNRYQHGNLEIYKKRLCNELGQAKVNEIESRPHRLYNIADLETMIWEMEQKILGLRKGQE